MSCLDKIQTDPSMAEKSVMYTGESGNFKHSYQDRNVGKVVMPEDAPVALILSAAVAGTVATADADKWWGRAVLDWIYVLAMSFFDNNIQYSVKVGDYNSDTTARPFNSLLA
jgi:hypothetical protein